MGFFCKFRHAEKLLSTEMLCFLKFISPQGATAPALRARPNPPLPAAEFEKLGALAVQEAKVKGTEMPWYAAWGQRI